MKRVYGFVGGRKVFAGYLSYLTAITLGLILDADYSLIMGFVVAALGVTQVAGAWDDRASKGKLGGS